MAEDLNDLYRQKGEITTSIEILQSQLKAVNGKIIDVINRTKKPTIPVTKKEQKNNGDSKCQPHPENKDI